MQLKLEPRGGFLQPFEVRCVCCLSGVALWLKYTNDLGFAVLFFPMHFYIWNYFADTTSIIGGILTVFIGAVFLQSSKPLIWSLWNSLLSKIQPQRIHTAQQRQ
jgi:hypothetical protein